MKKSIRILFAGEAPDLRFVEVEDINGKSLKIGTWKKEGEYQVLEIIDIDKCQSCAWVNSCQFHHDDKMCGFYKKES